MNNVPFGTVSYIQQMLRTIAGENENVKNIIPDIVMVDPPRKGLDNNTVNNRTTQNTEIKRDTI